MARAETIENMARAAFDDKNHARKSYDELTDDWKDVWRSKMRDALRVFINETPLIRWECFCDEGYFHQWAVRQESENRWGHCFHLPTKEEAEALCGLLNNDD